MTADKENKLETYHGPDDLDRHGQSGPIHISDGGFQSEHSADDYISTLESSGLPRSRDMQSLDANNCCEKSLRYVSPDGRRQDAAHTFLHPRLRDGKHPSLHVLVETRVVRVLFDGGSSGDDDKRRACGVEVTPNPDFQLEMGVTRHPKVALRARRLVVVSCGANGSPSVLERSGLGGAEVLARAGVPVVADLPGVGENLQDHHLALFPFKTSLAPRQTIDFLLGGRETAEDLLASGDKILGWNLVEAAVKMQPREEDLAALDPALLAVWERDYKDKPNRPLMLMATING